MGIEKVGISFNEYCANNKILKVLLPLSVPILLVTAVIRFLQNFISIGSVASALVYVGFILGVLLTFAKSEYKMMSIGIGICILDYAYAVLMSLIKYQSISWGSLIYILIWGFFAFMAYKKSIKLGI